MDGMTERMNRTFETVLRAQINPSQDDWDQHLPMAEYAINNSVNETTGYTPFFLMYGMHPRKPIDMIDKQSITPAAEEMVKMIKDQIASARSNILKAQQSQKTQADKHRREHDFKEGDQVYLSTRNLTLSTANRKLSPKWVGPFEIIKKIHKDAFRLDLQGKFRIHPVFHSSLLKHYEPNDDELFPGRHQPIPPPVHIDGEEEYEVEAIIGKRRYRGKTQYLVKWKRYHEEDSSWEPVGNLSNAKWKIAEYEGTNRSRNVHMIRIGNSAVSCAGSGGTQMFRDQTIDGSAVSCARSRNLTEISHSAIQEFSG
jgi:hypothetical protein